MATDAERAERGVAEAAPRRRLLGALQGAPARRLLLLVLPGGQPPRRRGPHGADLPAGLPPLRARPARVAGAAAAAVADPHRPQPRGELLPRPLAAPADGDRRRGPAGGGAHDRGARGGPRRPEANPGVRAAAPGRPPRGADHALRARDGQPRDRPRARVAPTGPRRCCCTAPSGSWRSSSRTPRRGRRESDREPVIRHRGPPEGGAGADRAARGARAAHGEPPRHARGAGRGRARGVGAVGDARPAQLAAVPRSGPPPR